MFRACKVFGRRREPPRCLAGNIPRGRWPSQNHGILRGHYTNWRVIFCIRVGNEVTLRGCEPVAPRRIDARSAVAVAAVASIVTSGTGVAVVLHDAAAPAAASPVEWPPRGEKKVEDWARWVA